MIILHFPFIFHVNGNLYSIQTILILWKRKICFSLEVRSLVVARLKPDGSVDNSFDTGGITTLNLGTLGYTDLSPNALAVRNDKIIVVGTNKRESILIVRFNSDGSLDQSFSQDGVETLDGGFSGGNAVALQGDKVVVAGYGNEGNFVLDSNYKTNYLYNW